MQSEGRAAQVRLQEKVGKDLDKVSLEDCKGYFWRYCLEKIGLRSRLDEPKVCDGYFRGCCLVTHMLPHPNITFPQSTHTCNSCVGCVLVAKQQFNDSSFPGLRHTQATEAGCGLGTGQQTNWLCTERALGYNDVGVAVSHA